MQRNAGPGWRQRRYSAALDKQQANGDWISASATVGMRYQLVIALAKRSVPFACFGLSRVHFVGYRIPFSLAQAREGMVGVVNDSCRLATSSVTFGDTFSRSLNRRLWHCRAKSSFRSPLPFALPLSGQVPTGHTLISSASRGRLKN